MTSIISRCAPSGACSHSRLRTRSRITRSSTRYRRRSTGRCAARSACTTTTRKNRSGSAAAHGTVRGLRRVAGYADWVDPRFEELKNSSVFGSLGFDLAENWTLDLEARYAKDERNFKSGQRSEATGESDPVTDQLEFSAFTPRATLNWKPTDDMLVYGLVAKGNKPGGFNVEYFRSDVPSEFSRFLVECEVGTSLPPNPGFPQGLDCTEEAKDRLQFKEEEQWTYEAGIKSQWLDRRVTANLSVFYIDWTNQGLFLVDGVPQRGVAGTTPITIIVNAGPVEDHRGRAGDQLAGDGQPVTILQLRPERRRIRRGQVSGARGEGGHRRRSEGQETAEFAEALGRIRLRRERAGRTPDRRVPARRFSVRDETLWQRDESQLDRQPQNREPAHRVARRELDADVLRQEPAQR